MTPGDDWSGFTYHSPVFMNAAQREAYERLMPDPTPTFEERRQRCEDMGLVLCSCTGVETEQGRKLLYNMRCPIHGSKR